MYRKPLRLANKNDRKDMIMIPEVIIQIIGQPEKQCIIGIDLILHLGRFLPRWL